MASTKPEYIKNDDKTWKKILKDILPSNARRLNVTWNWDEIKEPENIKISE